MCGSGCDVRAAGSLYACVLVLEDVDRMHPLLAGLGDLSVCFVCARVCMHVYASVCMCVCVCMHEEGAAGQPAACEQIDV